MENKVQQIRKIFSSLMSQKKISENGTLEIVNASFIADEPSIFGDLNEDYAKCEVDWYISQSLAIKDMPCEVPKIWNQVASRDGLINSNYGWCILSPGNKNQFEKCISTLLKDPFSRQAVMIYIRPSMHEDASKNGMKDFMCTFATQILIREGFVHYIVFMRSNDAVFGYKNDRYWHNVVHDACMIRLNQKYSDLKKGQLYWNSGSLHIYPRHFKLVEAYK